MHITPALVDGPLVSRVESGMFQVKRGGELTTQQKEGYGDSADAPLLWSYSQSTVTFATT
jgi:hypothetical protein